MMVYIIQHTEVTTPGTTLSWLLKNKIPFQLIRAGKDKFPLPQQVKALIICGGGLNVDQEDKFPWLSEEKKLILDCITLNKKVLGLCLGGQLIAEVLGGRVGKHSTWELGWHDVELKLALGFDVPHAGQKLRAFQWHGYSFEIPKGASSFASSAACDNQGFIFNNALVIGTQFHPEMTSEMIDAWIIDEGKLMKGPFCQSAEEIIAERPLQLELLTNWYQELLNKWWPINLSE